MKVLLDTNVVLDVALQRDPYFEASSQLFIRANTFSLELFITASTVTDLFYIIAKNTDQTKAYGFLTDLLGLVEVCTVNERHIRQALESAFPDFEDAVQAFSGIDAGIEIITTRNKRDFPMPGNKVLVLTPDELLQKLQSSQ